MGRSVLMRFTGDITLGGLTYVRLLVLWGAAAVTGACIAFWFFEVSGAGVLWVGGGLALSCVATVWAVSGREPNRPSQIDIWHDSLEVEKFDRYCEAFPLPAMILDGEGRVVSCNMRAQQAFALGRWEIIHQEFRVSNSSDQQADTNSSIIDTNKYSDLMLDDQRCFVAGKNICTGDVLNVPLRADEPEKSLTLVLVNIEEEDPEALAAPRAIEAPFDLRLYDNDRLLLRELNYDLRTRFQNASGILDLVEDPGSDLGDRSRFETLQQIYREAVSRMDSLLSFLETDEQNAQENKVTFGLDEFLNNVSFALGQSHDIESNEILFDVAHSAKTAIIFDRELLVKLVCHIVLHLIGGEQEKTILIRVRLERPDDSTPKINIEVLTEQPSSHHGRSEVFLDLEIARRIATQLGGKLYADYKYQELTGIAFKCDVENVDAYDSGLVVPAHLKKLRVLIVDDNEASREVFQKLASLAGWNADVAASGDAALHMMRLKQGMGETYDVLLVDWRMEGLDGWETSKQVRAMQEGGKTPIIVMISAHNRSFLSKNMKDRDRVLNGFLTKPVTLTTLLDAVADATAHVQEPVLGEAANRTKEAPLADRTVLIVDDNQMHREVAREFITRSGAKVLAATGGYDAISVVQKNRDTIDVVLMDVHMPDLNGFDAVQRIRDLGITDIAILMMTANNNTDLRRRSLEVGANNVVIKPFVMRELVDTISMHLSEPRLTKGDPPETMEYPTGSSAACKPS